MILGGTFSTTPEPILPPLNLIATERVQSLSQLACDVLVALVAAHFIEHDGFDRATFLRLADEAEAVAGR